MNEEEKIQFAMLFANYLRHNKCTSYYLASNQYSGIDGFFESGRTDGTKHSLVFELKNRSYNVWEYPDAFIERKKFNALKTMASILAAPAALYICQYYDCILFFDVKNINPEWVSGTFRKNNDEATTVTKEVCYLPYATASIILSTNSWEKKTADELMNYLKRKTTPQCIQS